MLWISIWVLALCVCRYTFASTHLLARPVGPINTINMFNPEIDSGNIIAVSEEDLKEDQKQAMEKAIEENHSA
jgi:hypothetical protein